MVIYHARIRTVMEKYMAQSLHIGLSGPFSNLPFGICAVYFDLKVNEKTQKQKMIQIYNSIKPPFSP